jgi:hypothetical protein
MIIIDKLNYYKNIIDNINYKIKIDNLIEKINQCSIKFINGFINKCYELQMYNTEIINPVYIFIVEIRKLANEIKDKDYQNYEYSTAENDRTLYNFNKFLDDFPNLLDKQKQNKQKNLFKVLIKLYGNNFNNIKRLVITLKNYNKPDDKYLHVLYTSFIVNHKLNYDNIHNLSALYEDFLNNKNTKKNYKEDNNNLISIDYYKIVFIYNLYNVYKKQLDKK